MTMKRREFLINTMLLGAAGLAAPVPRIYGAVDGGYTGRLLITLQIDGGWDVSSYCDPKVNQPGELAITNWSESNDIATAGNIAYAPFANNSEFFDKYYRDMLVINGIDAQTNSHTTGVLHNWSGRNSVGYPTLTAMFAALNAPDQPLSYVNFGGFAQTGNLIRFSRIDDVVALRELLNPASNSWGNEATQRSPEDMSRIQSYRQARINRKMASERLTPRQLENLSAYDTALRNRSSLVEFSNYLLAPEDYYDWEEVNEEVQSDLRRQIQLTMSAFDAGVASAADLFTSGYDTHTDHDALHEPLFTYQNNAIDMLWTLAAEYNLADRLTVIIASDFSRTPHYNADDGKDHWPIGSAIIMESSPSWGNRVIGETDEAQNAYRINPNTLARDDSDGTIIYPKHVHKALRRYLGLENTAVDQNFRFNSTEDFDFFG